MIVCGGVRRGDDRSFRRARRRASDGVEQGVQVHQQVGHRLIALVGRLRQALVDDALELHRHACAQRCQRLGLLVEDAVEESLLVFCREWRLSADHLVEHDAERPDIRAAVDRAAFHLLGRHVSGRAELGAFAGELGGLV